MDEERKRVRLTMEQKWGIVYVLLMLLSFVTLLVLFGIVPCASQYERVNRFCYTITLIFSITLITSCLMGRHASDRQKTLFLIVCWASFFFTAVNADRTMLEGRADWNFLYSIVTHLGCLLVPVYWVSYWLYQKQMVPKTEETEKRRWYDYFPFILCGIYAALIIVNFFVPIFFTVENAVIVTGTPSDSDVFFTVIWYVFYIAYIVTRKCPVTLKLALLTSAVVPMVIGLSGVIFKVEWIAETAGSMMSLAYLLPLYLIFFIVYNEHEHALLAKDKALTDSRLNSMILQINPHFIYNTLGSIASLCVTDPEAAADLTCKFSDYLRDNDKNLTGTPMIPFDAEIKILEHYLSIEQVRFPNLTVKYDLDATDFMIPSLSVQPLVENAIRHGICKRRRSEGTVSVSAYENETAYVVRVVDNGIGFNELPNDGKKHIGIANVRTRLSILCNGTLNVTSSPDWGTVCEITIPKGETKNDRSLR